MAWISYDAGMNYESGTEGLAIYLPTEKGTINYNFVHTVNEDRNADMWRLSITNLCDKDGNFIKQITKSGAEWEMAVRIAERPDFIGGYAHGDEKFTSLVITIDGVVIDDITTLNQKEFSSIAIIVCSEGYDPNDGITKVLEHKKGYTITKSGITLHQKVRWCNDYILDSKLGSYLAMMPPMKHSKTDLTDIITDSYYTNTNVEPAKLDRNGYSIKNTDVDALCVFGTDSGICFRMTKSVYQPEYNHGKEMIVTDNGEKNNYNKMYFVFAQDDRVSSGDIWSATTIYQIEWK